VGPVTIVGDSIRPDTAENVLAQAVKLTKATVNTKGEIKVSS